MAGPGGVLADAVGAGVGGEAGGEEDAGVHQLKLPPSKEGEVGATIFLSTILTALTDGLNGLLDGDHTLVQLTSL